METNTDIKVIIDIHRDAIGTETQKVKPVFTYDGKQGAQIMIHAQDLSRADSKMHSF